MTAITNKKFEIPLAFLIGFLCMPTGLFAIMYLVLLLAALLGINPHGPRAPIQDLAVMMLDLVILGLLGILPFLAALGLWLVLLVAGRNRAAKFVTFICLLFAVGGIVVVRSMAPH
jgi:hypothetical protein